MKAAVWHGGSKVLIEEQPLPSIGPDDVLIRVAYAGVCGSDLHLMDGWLIEPPAVFGHEFSGVVEGKGSNVKICNEGDRVVAHPLCSCGECVYCRSGRQNLCRNPIRVLSHGGGAFAEYTVVSDKSVFVLPSNMDLKTAALIEPLAVAVHVVGLADVKPGAFVVVLGGGAIGLLCLKMAQHVGAGAVALVEPSPSRQDVARAFGASFVADPEEIQGIVSDVTGGLGADVCIEGVGAVAAVEQAVELVKPGGRVVIAGWAPPDKKAAFKPANLFRQEIGIQGSFWSSYSAFRTAIDLVGAWGDELLPIVKVLDGLHSLPEAVRVMRSKEVVKPLVRIT